MILGLLTIGPKRSLMGPLHTVPQREGISPMPSIFIGRSFFQADGTLKTLPALNSLLSQNEIRPNQEIIVYCTGGVRSGMAYFVFRYLGFKVRNYDGSWWDWSRSSFPVEHSG